MSGSSVWRPDVSADGKLWDQRYEPLRQIALAGATGGGWGLALVCRRGMAAWMRAWPSSERSPGHDSEPVAAEPNERICLPGALHEQLVGVMAGMILDAERGIPA